MIKILSTLERGREFLSLVTNMAVIHILTYLTTTDWTLPSKIGHKPRMPTLSITVIQHTSESSSHCNKARKWNKALKLERNNLNRHYLQITSGERNGKPLQYSCLENAVDRGAWWAAVHEVAQSRTQLKWLSMHACMHALEKEMAAHSSVLAWRIPGTEEPGGLLSMGSHRVGHD